MTIEVVNVVEHEDGSATYSIEMSEEEKEIFAKAGIRFSIILAGFNITENELFNILKEREENEGK